MSPQSSSARQKYGMKKTKMSMHKKEMDKSSCKGKMSLETAMKEVHENIPKNVKKTGKKGKAKEAILRAIGFSKAGMSRK